MNRTRARAPAFALPPPVRPGDTIAVIAPSSPFPPVLAWVGLGFLAQRYRLRFDRGLFARRGYLAGDDERRRAELERALADPQVRAIIAVRGGYGASRFVHAIDWSRLARAPRWIVGFSDVTAVHIEAARVGVASLHAPHVTALGRGDARTREAFVRALEAPTAARTWSGLTTLRAGSAEGPLVGGNLAVLHACAAAGRLVVPKGAVVLLEDVTERPYRVDRMLATLDVGGHLERAAAFVLGDFHECEPGPDGVRVEHVLAERLTRFGVPVVAGMPVGHAARNDPVVLGASCRVDAAPEGARVTSSSP